MTQKVNLCFILTSMYILKDDAEENICCHETYIESDPISGNSLAV